MNLFKPLLTALSIISLVSGLPRAEAHPVAFEGALSLLGFTSSKEQDFQALYSWNPRIATGLRQLRFETERGPRQFSLVQANWLVRRWNEKTSQANLYLGAGGGVEKNARLAGLGSIEADWESRRLYTSGQYQSIGFSRNPAIQSMKLRAGFAPYLAEYTELHSWFILELSRTPRMERKTEITPLIRIFYRNILTEFGRSVGGDFKFNFMVHY